MKPNGAQLKPECAALIKDMQLMLTHKPSKQIFNLSCFKNFLLGGID